MCGVGPDGIYHYRVYQYGVLFFFKQKTAYDMRISDWSSDVCSSDLSICPPATSTAPAQRSFCKGLPGSESTARSRISEIGRASCRERACRSVKIPVVTVSLQTTSRKVRITSISVISGQNCKMVLTFCPTTEYRQSYQQY